LTVRVIHKICVTVATQWDDTPQNVHEILIKQLYKTYMGFLCWC